MYIIFLSFSIWPVGIGGPYRQFIVICLTYIEIVQVKVRCVRKEILINKHMLY